ncbi:MAG: hypothetical protein HKM04_10065 [Legionellales bacterium]|nr:hypothetical protein [Legionellales bacterium]
MNNIPSEHPLKPRIMARARWEYPASILQSGFFERNAPLFVDKNNNDSSLNILAHH